MKLPRDLLAIQKRLLSFEEKSPATRAQGEVRSRAAQEFEELGSEISTLQFWVEREQARLKRLREDLPRMEQRYRRELVTYLLLKKKDLEENR